MIVLCILPLECQDRNMVYGTIYEDAETSTEKRILAANLEESLRYDLGIVKHKYIIPSCYVFLFKERRLQ